MVFMATFLSSIMAALVILAGCSSSSSPGASGKDAGTGKDGSSPSSDASTPSGKYASCVPVTNGGAIETCFAFALADGGSAATVCAADTENMETWTSVTSCASAGLVGCCGMGGNWQCFYSDTNNPESACTGDDGAWTKTAP
jgi:hypothetical protein